MRQTLKYKHGLPVIGETLMIFLHRELFNTQSYLF